MSNPDYLIVGGGSAGAVLAARLTDNPAVRVLLIEAGADTPPGAVPSDIADVFPSSSLNPHYFWPQLRARRRPGGPLYPFPQARIMGGGSSIMGMWALRGMPSDFEAWADAGAEGWGPLDVRPYYRKLENDLDRDLSQRSAAAPYTIRRPPRQEWPECAAALERAAIARGLAVVEDINENPTDGFFPMPVSQSETARSSSASAYLTAEVRRRPNLRIMSDSLVTAIRFEERRACGVTVRRGDQETLVSARETILSAGAIHSPAMLIRSGIGPEDQLRRLGTAPVAVRAGVGQNLQNHPYLNLALTLPPRSRQDAAIRHFAIAGIRLSSGLEECPPADLLVFVIGRVSGQAWGPGLAMAGAALYAPCSRGSVTLSSPDITVEPDVSFALMSDPRDAPRMLAAARFAEGLLFEPGVADTFRDAFLLPPFMALDQFHRPGLAGALLAHGAKLVLNAPSVVSRLALNRMLRPGRWIGNRQRRRPLSDDEILSAVAPMGHVTSTCAIGRRDDPMAVVDSACRVHGVENLRVVDASIMPRVPSANTNLTTIMIAERAAELLARPA
ncbi:MAG: GMC family oxidoreductase N-terminal domain-containing protein [Xanthobacteraceae bacterium]|nr:GMC family oxidoreductase N-terminal domain-containing protein [Xanthobacteraceae bacterium]